MTVLFVFRKEKGEIKKKNENTKLTNLITLIIFLKLISNMTQFLWIYFHNQKGSRAKTSHYYGIDFWNYGNTHLTLSYHITQIVHISYMSSS